MFISHKVQAIFLSVSDIYSYPNSLDDSYSITIMSSTVILAYQGNYRNERVKKSASSDSSTDEKDVINADGFDVQESDDSVIQQMKTVMNMTGEDENNQESTEKNDKAAAVRNSNIANQGSSNPFLSQQNSFSFSQELPQLWSPSSPSLPWFPSLSSLPSSPRSPSFYHPNIYSSYQNEENSDYLQNLTREPINERLTIRVILPDGTLLREITRNNNE